MSSEWSPSGRRRQLTHSHFGNGCERISFRKSVVLAVDGGMSERRHPSIGQPNTSPQASPSSVPFFASSTVVIVKPYPIAPLRATHHSCPPIWRRGWCRRLSGLAVSGTEGQDVGNPRNKSANIGATQGTVAIDPGVSQFAATSISRGRSGLQGLTIAQRAPHAANCGVWADYRTCVRQCADATRGERGAHGAVSPTCAEFPGQGPRKNVPNSPKQRLMCLAFHGSCVSADANAAHTKPRRNDDGQHERRLRIRPGQTTCRSPK